MICDRFAFVVVYLALSGFKPSHSWAAKPNVLNTNLLRYQTTLPQDVINPPHQTGFAAQAVSPQIQFARQELAPSDSEVTLKRQAIAKDSLGNLQRVKESKAINQVLPFGGMALTSAIALFLTWALFSKPKQRQELSPTNENFKLGEASATSDTVASSLIQGNTVASWDLESARDYAGELKKSLIPGKVALNDPPLVDIGADIDVVQELINDLQHPENYPHSDPESYPHKYSDLENVGSFAESLSPEISIRRKAIEKLAQVGDHRSIEALLNVIPQVGALEKSSILQAISQINERTFQSINHELFLALIHENPEVRLNALRDLRNLYQFVSPVITAIAKVQSDQDYEIRITATETLRQMNANPLPSFSNYYCDRQIDFDQEVDDLAESTKSDNNLHLVAYLLAELDAEK
jgi:HEAT repeat protein